MKKRILVVDDEPDLTHLLKASLEREGYYEVQEENDPLRAVEAARDFDPHLIVLDIMMPAIDGTEVAVCLRQDPRFARTPIIFMTALVLVDEAPLGICDRGGQTFLPKLTPVERLIDCIESKTAGPCEWDARSSDRLTVSPFAQSRNRVVIKAG